MTQDILVALLVVGFPAVALGLLLAPLCGQRYAAWALGPVAALALIMLACRGLTQVGVVTGASRSWTLVAVGVLATLLCARKGRPVRWLAAPGLAAAVVLILLLLPLMDRGLPSVLGYGIGNDSAFHATTATWIADGREPLPPGSSGALAVSHAQTGYPVGSHELLALAVPVSDGGAVGVFQPVFAVILAFGAFVAWWAIRRVGARPGLAAVGAVLAAAGYLQYEFFAQGFLSQMAATPFVFGAIALGVEGAATRRLAPIVLALVTAVAATQAYSLGVAAYMGPALALCVVVAVLRSPNPGRVALVLGAGTLLAAVVVFVAFRPLVDQAVDYIQTARDGGLEAAGVGNLPGPADRRLIWGSWIGPDFRYPYLRWRVTEGGIAIAVALAAIGLAWCLVRRRIAVPLLVGAAVLGYLVIRRDAGIYYTAKTYQMIAFPLACAVAAGAAAFVASSRPRLHVAGAVVAGALLAGYGIASWRSLEAARAGTTFSNPELVQLEAFADATDDTLGLGLVTDDLAKAEVPTADNRGDQQYLPLAPGTRPARHPGLLRVLDLDQFPADVLGAHSYIVERRLGGVSMPGPPYRLAATTDDFRLWTRPPGPLASARRPVELPGELGGATVRPGATLGLADASWERVRIGVRPLDSFLLALRDHDVTGTVWAPWDAGTGHFVTVGAIQPLEMPVDVAVPGRYRVVVVGAPAEPFSVEIPGAATLRARVPTAVENRDGSQYLGTVELGRGRQRVLVGSGPVPDLRDISFVSAISLERDPPAPPAEVCVAGQRHTVAWDRPLEVDADEGSVSLENCGDVPLLVDWVEPLPAP